MQSFWVVLVAYAACSQVHRVSSARITRGLEELTQEPVPVEDGHRRRRTVERPGVGIATMVVDELLSLLIRRADEAEQNLQNALANLHNHHFEAGVENTTKADLADEATDALLRAAEERTAAMEATEKVRLMVEACTTLFAEVEAFKTSSEPRAAFQRHLTLETLNNDYDRLSQAVVVAERLDLHNLLNVLLEVSIAQKTVEEKDLKVGAGATVGIKRATSLVTVYGAQLQERQQLLSSAQALMKFKPLEPANAKLEISRAILNSISAASQKIAAIIKVKGDAYTLAVQQVSKLRQHGRLSNATTMKDIIQDMKSAGQAKADAEALSAAITKVMQGISNFFSMMEAYKSVQSQRLMWASKNFDVVMAKADQVRKQIDESMLLEVTSFFQLYTKMWTRTLDTERALPGEKPVFTSVRQYIRDKAVAVHEWLNEEMSSVCDYHGSCREVRRLVVEALEKKVTHCDERFTEFVCTEEHGGFAPSGRSCMWIPPQPEHGIRGDCKSQKPPTQNLRFHQHHRDGAGIFY